jgi:hypothetical protein
MTIKKIELIPYNAAILLVFNPLVSLDNTLTISLFCIQKCVLSLYTRACMKNKINCSMRVKCNYPKNAIHLQKLKWLVD